MTTSIAVATDGKTSPVDDTMLRVGVRLEVLWTEDGEENNEHHITTNHHHNYCRRCRRRQKVEHGLQRVPAMLRVQMQT